MSSNLPQRAGAIRSVGALLIEKNDERLVGRHDPRAESIALAFEFQGDEAREELAEPGTG